MVRTYVRKTARSEISEEVVKRAIEDIINRNRTIREAASHCGLTKSMLHKRLTKLKRVRDQQGKLPKITIRYGKSSAQFVDYLNRY